MAPKMSHEYGPYGTTVVASARNLYAGHPYDPSRGLYETPARDYEPTSGRFLAVDLGRQDASPYVYAGNVRSDILTSPATSAYHIS